MGPIAAIFDVDRTLVRGSTERLFFRHLLVRGLLPGFRALGYLVRLALNPQRRFQDKTYLRGLPVEEVLEQARQCHRQRIVPRLSEAGAACVREHKARGHGIVLLTGSLSFLMAPLQEELGADWLIATEAAVNGPSFTGETRGLHPRGENKLRLLLELAVAQGLDLDQSYGYGDHFQDFFFLGRCGHPVAVNPDRRLRLLAQRRGWPIRSF